jgi:hypothetical protein
VPEVLEVEEAEAVQAVQAGLACPAGRQGSRLHGTPCRACGNPASPFAEMSLAWSVSPSRCLRPMLPECRTFASESCRSPVALSTAHESVPRRGLGVAAACPEHRRSPSHVRAEDSEPPRNGQLDRWTDGQLDSWTDGGKSRDRSAATRASGTEWPRDSENFGSCALSREGERAADVAQYCRADGRSPMADGRSPLACCPCPWPRG